MGKIRRMIDNAGLVYRSGKIREFTIMESIHRNINVNAHGSGS